MRKRISFLIYAVPSLCLAMSPALTPLHRAAYKGDLKQIKKEIDNGASCEQKTSVGNLTAHDIALIKGHAACQDYLKKLGSWGSTHGCTEFHLAALFNDADFISKRMRTANLKKTTDDGHTIFHFAVHSDSPHILDIIDLRNFTFNNAKFKPIVSRSIPDKEQFTPIQHVVRYGSGHHISSLREFYFDWNVTTKSGETLVHLAAQNPDPSWFSFFIEHHRYAEKKNNKGLTPGQYAALYGTEKHITALKNNEHKRRLLSEKTADKRTLVHLAACNKDVGVLESLLDYSHVYSDAEDTRGWKPIHYAARYSTDEVAQLLNYDEAVTDDGSTVLHLAAQNDDPSCLELFLERSHDVEQTDNAGLRPLHVAAWKGALRNVKLLLEKEASPRTKTTFGATLVHMAARNKDQKVVELFLKQGLSPTAQDNEGNLPVHDAAQWGTVNTLKVLMKKGALLTVESGDRSTLVHKAARNKDTAVLEFVLSKRLSPTTKNTKGSEPIHEAAQYGAVKHLRLLRNKGASLAAVTHDKTTVVHCAAKNRNSECLDYVLKRNLSPSAENDKKEVPIQSAAMFGSAKNCELLEQAGASLNVLGNERATLIHLATMNPETGCLEYFLTKMNKEMNDAEGLKPLHYAAKYGTIEHIATLTKEGASLKAKSYEGYTIMHAGACNKNPKVLADLMRYTYLVPIDTQDDFGVMPIHCAAKEGTVENIKILIKNGSPSLKASTKIEATLLHMAAQNPDVRVLQYLIYRGFDVNAHRKGNFTPLDFAVAFGTDRHCRSLIEADASPESTSSVTDKTVLHVAAQNPDSSCLAYLLSLGMNVEVADRYGWMPLHVAAQKGFKKHIVLLLRKGGSWTAQASSGISPETSAQAQGLDRDELLQEAQYTEKKDFSQWLTLAQKHLKSAQALDSNGDDIHEGAILYLAQQCAEKALKAFLTYHKDRVSRTHDLEALLEPCVCYNKEFERFKLAMKELAPYAFETRYPKSDRSRSTVTSLSSANALLYAQEVLTLVRTKIKELSKKLFLDKPFQQNSLKA